MEFSELRTSSLVESKLDELLSDVEPILENIFEQPDFLNKFYLGQSKLIEFLAGEKTLQKIMDYLTKLGDPEKQSHAECYHYPFYAFTVLSNCHPLITRAFLSYKKYIDILFQITSLEGDAYLTCHGYAQGIYKNLLSDNNPLSDEFVKIIVEDYEKYIIPLTKNLNRANAEIIAATLTFHHYKLKKSQEELFNELIKTNYAILNVNDQYEEITDNIKKILDTVVAEGFAYQPQLIATDIAGLIESNIEPERKHCMFKAHLLLLIYAVKTEQLHSPINLLELFELYYSLKKIVNSKSNLILILDLLKFISQHQELKSNIEHTIIKELLTVVENNRFNDIIHSTVFAILCNIIDFIVNNDKSKIMIIDFVLDIRSRSRLPAKAARNPNPISLNFIKELTKAISAHSTINELEGVNKELLLEYSKLCFENELEEYSQIDESSEVKPVLKDSSGVYKLSKSSISDKRFRDEEEIAPPELLSDVEKFSAGSLVIQQDLFDSLVIDEAKPTEELIDIQIGEKEVSKSDGNLVLPLKQSEKIRSYRPKSPYICRGNYPEGNKDLKQRLFSPEPLIVKHSNQFNDSYNDIVKEKSKNK